MERKWEFCLAHAVLTLVSSNAIGLEIFAVFVVYILP